MDNRQYISCAPIDEGGTGLAAWNSLAAYASNNNNNETFPINSTSYPGYTMQCTLSNLRRLETAFNQHSNPVRSQSEVNDDDEEWSLDGIFLSPDTASATTNPSNNGNDETDDRTEPAFGALQLRQPPLRFLPSFRVRGERQQLDQGRMRRALAAGVNPTALHTYQGSFDKFSLQSMNTSNERNCCLFVYKIHPSVQRDLRKFFAQIYHGKVFSFSLNPPEGNHFSCAAKLAFMTRASAELFMRDIVFPGIFIDGMRLKAYWNRDKVCPTAEHAQKSRVVCFAGPNLTLGYLEWIFNNVMYYDLVASRSWLSLCASTTAGHQYEQVVEMHFSSLRGQSQMAVLRFENYF